MLCYSLMQTQNSSVLSSRGDTNSWAHFFQGTLFCLKNHSPPQKSCTFFFFFSLKNSTPGCLGGLVGKSLP